ncbi:MAG: DUF5058 family protein [Clostridia bacterium]|nr:DUF5058 family protein [Clostridia bacterium]
MDVMETSLLNRLNSPAMYGIVALAIGLVVAMCIYFMIKSWRAGVAVGMDKAVLRKAIVSSATFTLLPAFSVLLGVVALSGSMGIPLPWLRLSVIGNLQYEVNVAQIAATSVGLSGLKITEMTPQAFVTIALVMTAGILGGALLCLFTLKAYSKKLSGKPRAVGASKKTFGDWAMVAMFVGMCAAYIGSYMGQAAQGELLPLATAIVAADAMYICEYLERKKSMQGLENFDLAASMLIAMAACVLLGRVL